MTSRNLLLSVLFALPLALAFPPFRIGFLACWALIPLLMLIENKLPGETAVWCYSAGFLLSLPVLFTYGLGNFGQAAPMILTPSIFLAAFGLAVVPLRRRWPVGYLLAVPVLWTALEYLRSLTDYGLPWFRLGYTQSFYLGMIQYLPGDTVYGVTFWVVSINAILFGLWRQRESGKSTIAMVAILLALLALPYACSRSVIRNHRGVRERTIEVRAPLQVQESLV